MKSNLQAEILTQYNQIFKKKAFCDFKCVINLMCALAF